MKVAVATMNGGLEDNVFPMFGRCRNFTFVEVEEKEIKNTTVEENQFANAAGGAGIQAAQFVIEKSAEIIIAGNFGPNATSVFSQSNIKMIATQGNVKDVMTQYLRGTLQSMPQASSMGVGGGMGRGAGIGRSQGRGMGRRGQSRGPGGECACPQCGYTAQHQLGTPCYTIKCPKCGIPLIRG